MTRYSQWSRAFPVLVICSGAAVVLALVQFVTDPGWVTGGLVLATLAGFTLLASSAISDKRLRQHAPRDPQAAELYAELKRLSLIWRGRMVESREHEVVLYCPDDSFDVVVRMGHDQLDFEHGVMTGERLILTPFQPIVLRVVQGHRFEVDEDDRIQVLPEQGERIKASQRSVKWMLRTGAGVLTVEEMCELAEQLRRAEPLNRFA